MAFLARWGIPEEDLCEAARLSVRHGTFASHELLASGFDRRLYWSLLAEDLGPAFVERLDGASIVANAGMLATDAVRLANCVLVRHGQGTVLVVAPRPDEIALLRRRLAETPQLASRLRIATPETIRDFVVAHRHPALTHYAVNRLACVLPPLSARRLARSRGASGVTTLAAAALALVVLSPVAAVKALALLATAFFFNCSVWKMAAALKRPRPLRVEPVLDHRLPNYTVLVPLYREAAVVPDLVRHMKRIDYPALCSKSTNETGSEIGSLSAQSTASDLQGLLASGQVRLPCADAALEANSSPALPESGCVPWLFRRLRPRQEHSVSRCGAGALVRGRSSGLRVSSGQLWQLPLFCFPRHSLQNSPDGLVLRLS